MAHILSSGEAHLDGILGPSHVSTIIGSHAYTECCKQYFMPLVIAGFEPLDVIQSNSVVTFVQINESRFEVENHIVVPSQRVAIKNAQALMSEIVRAATVV